VPDGTKHSYRRTCGRTGNCKAFHRRVGKLQKNRQKERFSLAPVGKTLLDYAVENGYKVKAVGKIEDIFGGRGITESVHIHDNMDGVDRTLSI